MFAEGAFRSLSRARFLVLSTRHIAHRSGTRSALISCVTGLNLTEDNDNGSEHALAIAGLMATSTAAFAETLSAKIDFPFRAGSRPIQPRIYTGSYRHDGSAPVITVSNPATSVSSMLYPCLATSTLTPTG